MPRLIDYLGTLNPTPVLLAIAICMGGIVLSRLMFIRALAARENGFDIQRRHFEAACILTAGLSVWSAHLLAMHAYKSPVPLSYDAIMTALSFAIGMAGSIVRVRIAMGATRESQRYIGAAAFSAGLLGMHFVGLAGIRAAGEIVWNLWPVAISAIMAVAFGTLAVPTRGVRHWPRIVMAAALGTLSVCSLHFVSMFGLSVHADPAVTLPALAIPGHIILTWVTIAEITLILMAGFAVVMGHWSRSQAMSLLREAIDAMPDGMGIYDEQDRLLVWNARYAELNPGVVGSLKSGLRFSDMISDAHVLRQLADSSESKDDWIAERLKARSALSCSIEQQLQGDRWLRIQDRRMTSGGIVTVCNDITDLKRGSIALAEARDAAEAANQSKSEFLANMSHEIRTPLNGVIGLAQALARTELNADQREMLDLIQSSGHTLQTLLSDILDLARVESGRLELADEPFDLTRAVNDAAQLYTETATAKGLQFFVDIDPDADLWVRGDVVRTKQILTNLVSNAIKFTNQGFVSLTVTRFVTKAGQPRLRFAIEDTGVGFDAATRDRLFTRFEQADGTITRRFGGTGLGLAICRQLAELMEGELDCESEPGGGSAFILTLPLVPASRPVPEAVATTVPVSNDHRLRVLVADDHPTNRRVVELILAQAPVDMVSVENGAEALAACRGCAFDLVLMDMQMPVMDGLTATREIRLYEQSMGQVATPIVMLTANALPEHIAASLAAGADRHLAKPFNAAELLELVADLGERQRALAA